MSKCLATTIYKPVRPRIRGTTLLRGHINHGPWLLTTYPSPRMILQAIRAKLPIL